MSSIRPYRRMGAFLMFLEVKDPTYISALLIDADDARRAMFNLTLGHGDIVLQETCSTCDEALAYTGACDLLIYYAMSSEPSVCDDIERLSQSASAALLVLLHSDNGDAIETLLDRGADHVLPVGPGANRLSVATVSALATGRKVRKVRGDLEQVQRALRETKSIARAKMILISRHRIGEDEAHRRVQKLSMERNLPLAEMAQQIIDAEDLLC